MSYKDNNQSDLQDDLERMHSHTEELEEALALQKRVAFAAGLFQGDVTVRTLLESLAEGVVVIDSTGTVIFINQRAEQMFDCSREDVVGRSLNLLLPDQYSEAHTRHVIEYFEHPRIRPMGQGLVLAGRRKGGTEFPLEISLSHLHTEAGTLGLAFITDITKRYQAEQELVLRNEELDAFAHTVAHDLKGPLGNIIGFANLLREDIADSPPEVRENLEYIEVHAMQMADMIDQLLLLAKLRDTSTVLKHVSMQPVVQAAMARFEDQIADRQIAVEVAPDLPGARGYAPWLQEVFANLISNAIKYLGEDNPAPQIVIRGEQQGNRARFEVQDNGVGIALEDQDRLFTEFTRFHESKALGHGLGLSIVRRIVARLEGQVGVESAPDQGSTFWFTLPVADSSQDTPGR
jgi:PAS domain S-box-containing protein